MHSKIKNCCNRHFTERSEWQYPILGWFLLMILLEREWKERLIYKTWVVHRSHTSLITVTCSEHILAKKKSWSVSSHQMMLIQSGLSQWCEIDGLFWHWDMQKTRGEKQNHGGRWSNYKEEGRWIVSLQSKVSLKYQKSSLSCACHWCGAFCLMNWNV